MTEAEKQDAFSSAPGASEWLGKMPPSEWITRRARGLLANYDDAHTVQFIALYEYLDQTTHQTPPFIRPEAFERPGLMVDSSGPSGPAEPSAAEGANGPAAPER